MKYGIYSIRDFKTGFLAPTVDQNDAAAIRNFEHAVMNTEQSLFFSHPEDYALYLVGEYNSEDGTIVPCLPCELITATQVFDSARSKLVKEVMPNGNEGRNT